MTPPKVVALEEHFTSPKLRGARREGYAGAAQAR
jgi:hypothetical protein